EQARNGVFPNLTSPNIICIVPISQVLPIIYFQGPQPLLCDKIPSSPPPHPFIHVIEMSGETRKSYITPQPHAPPRAAV
ncbi:MAG: hypothetical protein QGG39_18780, partial [Candidatus Poribacteria bacterium]|nr:hypothetical protein [Candidatus Poribacteria bacterium]